MNWMTCTLSATALYGVWGVLSKMASNRIGHKSLFIYDCLVFCVGGLVAFCLNGFKIETSPSGIFYSVLYGASGMIATFLFIVAISKGNASLVTAITAVYPCVTILLAMLLFKEAITVKQVVGIALSIVGVGLMTIK
ncbi:MAG: EamA family transporter [Blastocatellia bacterium]